MVNKKDFEREMKVYGTVSNYAVFYTRKLISQWELCINKEILEEYIESIEQFMRLDRSKKAMKLLKALYQTVDLEVPILLEYFDYAPYLRRHYIEEVLDYWWCEYV